MSASDEARWADAQSLLDRLPPQDPEERRRRRRMSVALFGVSSVVAAGAVGVLVAAVVAGSGPPPVHGDVPRWQGLASLVLLFLGLGVQLWGGVVYTRGAGPARKLPRPMGALTRRQRRELLGSIRGDRPVDAQRLGLTRQLAEERSRQLLAYPQTLGSLVLCLGLWVGDPTRWFLVWIVVIALYLLGASCVAWWNSRQARRFLEQHPASSAEVWLPGGLGA